MVNGKAYDTLCDKLEPYVALTMPLLSEKELADLKAQSLQDKVALTEVFEEEEEPYESVRRSLDDISYIWDFPDPYALRITKIKVSTELIAVSWSEALRKVYKERGEIKLRDCLLPKGFENTSWKSNLNRFGLGQEQTEDLLRIFGQKEIEDKIELPWGGYVQRVADGYELRGPE